MTDQPTPPPAGQPEGEGARVEQVRMQNITARVPESVSQGVFSTGVIVMTGATEFIIDFLQIIGRPRAVAARIVMPHGVLPQFIDALRKNLEMYTQRFGKPPEMPKAPGQPRPTIQEIYDDLKIPDELLPGAYANGVMISHAAAEFNFDFLTNFFPHSAVSARVFMAAPQAPRMLESLVTTYQQFLQRVNEQRLAQGQPPIVYPPPPGAPPEAGPPLT